MNDWTESDQFSEGENAVPQKYLNNAQISYWRQQPTWF
jgi:hypothetical protein